MSEQSGHIYAGENNGNSNKYDVDFSLRNFALPQDFRPNVIPQPVELTAVKSTASESPTASATSVVRSSEAAIQLISAVSTSAVQVNSTVVSQITAIQPLRSPLYSSTIRYLRPSPYLSNKEYYKLNRAERNRLFEQIHLHRLSKNTLQVQMRRQVLGQYRQKLTSPTLTHTRNSLAHPICSTSAEISNLRRPLLDNKVGGLQHDDRMLVSSEAVPPQSVIPQISQNIHSVSGESVVILTADGQSLISPSQSLNLVSSCSFTRSLDMPNLPQSHIFTSPPMPPISTYTRISPTTISTLPTPANTSYISAHTSLPKPSPSSISQLSTATSPAVISLGQVAPSSSTASIAESFKEIASSFASHLLTSSFTDRFIQQVIALKEPLNRAILEQDTILDFTDDVIRLNLPGITADDGSLTPLRELRDRLEIFKNLIDEIIDIK